MTRLVIGLIVSLVVSACGGKGATPSAVQASAKSPAIEGSPSGAQLNAIRAKANLPAVWRNATLDAAAQAHADDMAAKGFLSHRGSDGSTVGKRVTRAGYRWCSVAENISKGYAKRTTVIEQWRKSPAHYRNITKPKVKAFGMAKSGDYWVLVLAAKSC